jgi:Fic family protein
MLLATPPLEKVEMDVIARIDAIRAHVRFMLAEPQQWAGLFARLCILGPDEGAHDPAGVANGGDEAAGAADPAVAAASLDPKDEDDRAFAGYSEAMKYILHLHDDPHFVYQEGFVRSVHFMMLSYDPAKQPGRWRSGPIGVHHRATNELRYEGPPAPLVPALMRELMAWLQQRDNETPVLVRAAMAHLHLVKIHPFADGNGRMARALHTLVLVRAGILEPEFCSLEAYIGRHRERYFDSLADVGAVTWDPAGNSRPFVRFCLTAHVHQAEQVLGHARRMSAIWAEAERHVRKRHWPVRLAFALADAAMQGEIGNAAYRQWAGGSAQRARQDLQRLVDHGILIRSGAGRGRSYTAGPLAHEMRARVWTAYPPQPLRDPFEAL